MMYEITTKQEYWYCRERGIEPMLDRHFCMPIGLRRELQREIFGRGNKEANDIKFYHHAWESCRVHVCTECGKPLERYSSAFISHILSRGAFAECAYDLRNFNLLCFDCHQRWENNLTREEMRIYPKNLKTIEILKKEYNL